jgi:phosphodiesterase/alkaline phosphatase D-like protein
MTKITRRAAITSALFGGTAACSRAPTLTPYKATAAEANAVFAHGVASGDPGPDSVVIWTRATVPNSAPTPVAYDVANDAKFSQVIASGERVAAPENDFTVKVLVEGLAPGRAYHYRFRVGAATSPVGSTRTLPTGSLDAARFAVISCSNHPFGYFNVYDLIARQTDLDAVIHLGDYIYEYGAAGYGGEEGARLKRDHEPPHEIVTLEDYRRRHAQYKADPSSQAMHAAHPLIPIWDDHETADNAWATGANNHQPATEGDWNERRRVALQAYYEWMPIRDPVAGRAREAIFRSFAFGDLVTLTALETRLMARTAPIEYNDVVPTLTSPELIDRFRRDVLGDPARKMLGAEQEAFVAGALKASADRGEPWRLIANQVIMAKVTAPNLKPHLTPADIEELERQWDQARSFVEFSALGLPANLDAWDGYPAARERFYDAVKANAPEGLIVITGDTHTWWANDLVADDGAHMGVELGAHSVTSPSPYRKAFLGGKGAEYALLTGRENRDVRYISGEDHGFIDLTIRRDAAEARFMAVDTIESPAYNAFEKAAFTIRKSGGKSQFADVRGLSLKERLVF